ncbi:MAG: hypothetical protein F6K26_22225 [Moorea sp. SIO2I5]|nr:hypothetical protein [Moorena sp. SIO2I5]
MGQTHPQSPTGRGRITGRGKGKQRRSDAARSWGGSAAKGGSHGAYKVRTQVPHTDPCAMSNCRGFPHSRLGSRQRQIKYIVLMQSLMGKPHERLHQDREFGVSRWDNNRFET